MDSLTMDHEEEHLNENEKLEAEREFQIEISLPQANLVVSIQSEHPIKQTTF
jgi:hypothetical protein